MERTWRVTVSGIYVSDADKETCSFNSEWKEIQLFKEPGPVNAHSFFQLRRSNESLTKFSLLGYLNPSSEGMSTCNDAQDCYKFTIDKESFGHWNNFCDFSSRWWCASYLFGTAVMRLYPIDTLRDLWWEELKINPLLCCMLHHQLSIFLESRQNPRTGVNHPCAEIKSLLNLEVSVLRKINSLTNWDNVRLAQNPKCKLDFVFWNQMKLESRSLRLQSHVCPDIVDRGTFQSASPACREKWCL